ncbi:MAG: hypothetical protein JKY53_04580 [Flavobacteriales bacterium]|nr:hypothetical protein [Flavobacteriales bacterium]
MKKVFLLSLFLASVIILNAQKDTLLDALPHKNEVTLKLNQVAQMFLGGSQAAISNQLMYKKLINDKAIRIGLDYKPYLDTWRGGLDYRSAGHVKLNETDSTTLFRNFSNDSYTVTLGLGVEKRYYKRWGGWYYGVDLVAGVNRIQQSYYDMEYTSSPYDCTASSCENIEYNWEDATNDQSISSALFVGGLRGFIGMFYSLNKRITFLFETGVLTSYRIGNDVVINSQNEYELNAIQEFEFDQQSPINNFSIVYKLGY